MGLRLPPQQRVAHRLWQKKNNCAPTDEDLDKIRKAEHIHTEESILSNTVWHLICAADMTVEVRVETASFKWKSYLCIGFATSDWVLEDSREVPQPETWAKLKEILDTKKDPMWYPIVDYCPYFDCFYLFLSEQMIVI